MQCPETPQISTRHALASPTYTTLDTDPPKKNLNPHDFVQRCLSERALGPIKATTRQRVEEAETGHHHIPKVASSSRNFSKPLRQIQHLDDALGSQSKSSAAALQFHAAARRLALSPVSESLQNQSLSGQAPKEYRRRHHVSLGAERDSSSNDSSTQVHHSNRWSPIACDITSARKDTLQKHTSPHRRSLPSMPLKSQSFNIARRQLLSHTTSETSNTHNLPIFGSLDYGPPIPFDPTKGQERGLKKALNARNFSRPIAVGKSSPAKPRTRNFSRPARPKQIVPQAVPDSHTPTKTNNSICGTVPLIPSQRVDRIAHSPGAALNKSRRIVSIPNVNVSDVQLETVNTQRNETEQARETASDAQSAHSSTRESFESAVSDCLGDKRLQLSSWEIWLQRIVFALFVFLANIALGLAYLGFFKHPYILPILVFMKSKDVLSTATVILGLLHNFLRHLVWPPKKPDPRWILSLVCAYAETEEQILKTVFSLARGSTKPHKQAICIILDGKPRDILGKMSSVSVAVQRPYTTWRGNRGEITVSAGQLEGIPLIVVAKTKNAGKKDSLILGHDLFNYPRKDMPHSTQLLRKEIWQFVLPVVLPKSKGGFNEFDFIFCTDADSTIHDQALRRLADALCQENDAIAACGVLFAEFADWKTEYSPWHLFQQFQYTFGQYVRRQAESMWGRVTCLPGCITMIVVRPETGLAVSEYARPVTEHNLFRHQVQYLGTDRRFTWCMMSQGKHLRTVFVPDALSETVVPDGVSHYLSQRRRWASNAYFNDFFYLLGPRQRLITRLWAAIDIVRLSLVYYRVFNTGFFVHGLITRFYLVKIIPTLVVTKTPATWYLLMVLIREPLLRKRMHKILLGMCINQIMSPILSVIVFTNVIFHMGSQAWGKTGASTQGPAARTTTAPVTNTDIPPAQCWTPVRLANSVRAAIHGVTPKRRGKIQDQASASAAQNDVSRPIVHRGSHIKEHNSPLRSHPPEINNMNTPQMTGLDFDTTERTRMDTTPVACTPIRPKQNSCSTPGTLSRRTPFHRNRVQSKLSQVKDNPVRVTEDGTTLTYDE